MPTITRTITKAIQQPNVPVFTASATVPTGLNFVRIDMLIDPAMITDPTVTAEVDVQWANPASPTNFSTIASSKLVGNPTNDPTTPPYVELQGSILAQMAGGDVRGRLVANQAISLGATVTVDFT